MKSNGCWAESSTAYTAERIDVRKKMPEVWRLVRDDYSENAFDGEGARMWGGRFSSPGTALVYTSESLALAELEILVHLRTDEVLAEYVAFRVDVPNECIIERSLEELPSGWRGNPIPRVNWTVGDEWIQVDESVALSVPSAVVPRETNVLLNPGHPNFRELTIEGPIDPEFDTRI